LRILIAEDDSTLTDGLSRALRKSGYAVDCVESGPRADSALSTQVYDAVILDLGLPGLTGLEVLKRLRARGAKVPVLILTAADSIEQRVRGLDLGADDFMAKPFSLSELEARVRAIVRRHAGAASPVMSIGNLTFDQAGRVARVNERNVELSAREIGLLEILIQRSGRLVSKEQIVDHLCEWGEEVSHNAIEVYVHRLRKKIEESDVVISTVRGLGYCLQRPADIASDPASRSAARAASAAAVAAGPAITTTGVAAMAVAESLATATVGGDDEAASTSVPGHDRAAG